MNGKIKIAIYVASAIMLLFFYSIQFLIPGYGDFRFCAQAGAMILLWSCLYFTSVRHLKAIFVVLFVAFSTISPIEIIIYEISHQYYHNIIETLFLRGALYSAFAALAIFVGHIGRRQKTSD